MSRDEVLNIEGSAPVCPRGSHFLPIQMSHRHAAFLGSSLNIEEGSSSIQMAPAPPVIANSTDHSTIQFNSSDGDMESAAIINMPEQERIQVLLDHQSHSFSVPQITRSSAPSDTCSIQPGSLSKWNMSQGILVLIAGSTFTVVSNIQGSLLNGNNVASKIATLDAKELVFFKAPNEFYVILFNSAGFISSMGAIAAQGWSLSHGPIVLLALILLAALMKGLKMMKMKFTMLPLAQQDHTATTRSLSEENLV